MGNGPIGFAAYQAYFAVPDNGADDELRGMWYSFTAGSVRVISLNNDDVCIQDGGNFYVRGYSGGAQKKWLEAELASARNDPRIDWIVVCMHQTAVSTGRITNGADLGIRTDWLPFRPLRSRSGGLRPRTPLRTGPSDPRDVGYRHVDARSGEHRFGDPDRHQQGTVHVVIGGGARRYPPTPTSSPSPGAGC